MELPNLEQIVDDLLNFKYTEKDNSLFYKNYYDNFLMFLRTSILYEIPDSTFSHTNFTTDNLKHYLEKLDLDNIFKCINKYNVYVCDMPIFSVTYRENDKLYIQKISLVERKDKLEKIVNTNDTVILYLMKFDYNLVRYCTLSKNVDYFFVKRRLKKQRKEKLDKINKTSKSDKVYIDTTKKHLI